MGPGELFKAKTSFLSLRFDLITSLPLLNKDTVDMACRVAHVGFAGCQQTMALHWVQAGFN